MREAEPGAMYGITTASRLGRAVRTLRRTRKLTQAELADAAGISRLCLRDLETGTRSVGSVNQLRVLNALGYEIALLPKSAELDAPDIWATDE